MRTLQEQKQIVSDNSLLQRVMEVINEMGEYSVFYFHLRLINRKKWIIFWNVWIWFMTAYFFLLYSMNRWKKWRIKQKKWNPSFKQVFSVIPHDEALPGKPIPPPSKQLHNSVNSYVEKAKSTLENTVSSAKSGDMKEKLSDNLSSLGEKMTNVFDKAKQKVQNFTNWFLCYETNVGVNGMGRIHFHLSILLHCLIEEFYSSSNFSKPTGFFTSSKYSTKLIPKHNVPITIPKSNSKTIISVTGRLSMIITYKQLR